MRTLSRSNALLWAILSACVFVIISTFIPRFMLMTILNGVFLGIVVCVMIVYAPLVWFTFRNGKLDRISQLSLGIGLIWLSIAGQRLYWIVWHSFGMPDSWLSNPFLSAMVFISIIGGGLFVTAPGYPPEHSLDEVKLWGNNRKLLLGLGAIGGLLTFLLSLYTSGTF